MQHLPRSATQPLRHSVDRYIYSVDTARYNSMDSRFFPQMSSREGYGATDLRSDTGTLSLGHPAAVITDTCSQPRPHQGWLRKHSHEGHPDSQSSVDMRFGLVILHPLLRSLTSRIISLPIPPQTS